MNQLKSWKLLLIVAIFFACESEEPNPVVASGQFTSGVFVINEGNFGDADGSLSFIHEDGKVNNTLFELANDRNLGDVLQSAHIVDTLIYLVVNNSNKVEIATVDSIKSVGTISDLALPRHMTSKDGFGYLTEWVSFTEKGRLTKIDLKSNQVVTSVETDFGAEGVVIVGGKVYVSNNFSTTVSIIDLNDFALIKNVEVGGGPNYLVADAEGDIWVGIGGSSDENYQPNNDGKLIEINGVSNEVSATIELNRNFNGKIAIAPGRDELYFTINNSINRYQIGEDNFTELAQFDATSLYGIGVSPDGEIYLTDAGTFVENGQVYQLDQDFEILNTYRVGRIPGALIFN